MGFKNLLHKNSLDKFCEFMRSKEYAPTMTKSPYEVIRFKHRKTDKIVIIYERKKGEHYTVQEKDYHLIREFFKYNPDNCLWDLESDNHNHWVTNCGHSFTINEGKPSDNNMEYCCYCGLTIMEQF